MRGMIDEVRSFGSGELFSGYPDFRIGTVTKPGRALAWRTRADFVFVQIAFGLQRVLDWRESLTYSGKMYAGVIVLASSRMARRINASIPDIKIPSSIVDKLDDDPEVGIEIALEQIEAIKASGAFDGVHLVPIARYRQIAERLGSRRGER